jgi:hypothetical protein
MHTFLKPNEPQVLKEVAVPNQVQKKKGEGKLDITVLEGETTSSGGGGTIYAQNMFSQNRVLKPPPKYYHDAGQIMQSERSMKLDKSQFHEYVKSQYSIDFVNKDGNRGSRLLPRISEPKIPSH